MTCTYCKADTADRDTYVAWGGFIWCDLDCIAKWVVENKWRFDADEKIEKIEKDHRVIEQ
jgi:hypothetical protein